MIQTGIGHSQGRTVAVPENLAMVKEAYMVRLQDSLPPASYGNDGDVNTVVYSSPRTVDGYWEVDLGQEYAVSQVQVFAADGFESRMTHTTVRLFDEQHESIFSKELDYIGPPIFRVDCGGPRRARYVRVGFELKERSSPDGSIEWYLGLKDVAVIGVPAAEVGLLSFTGSATGIAAGESVTLNWTTKSATSVRLFPEIVGLTDGIQTDPNGIGSLTLTPDRSREYTLVVEGAFGRDVRSVSVLVDNHPLAVRINEFVAQNQYSLEDGYDQNPDWIELYNPSNLPVDMLGYGLSDDVTRPMKWVFPEVTVAPHGSLLVFASGENQALDPAGHVHTSWRLAAGGESVVLATPDGAISDAIVNYPAQREDLAYGRDLQGELAFLDPTPGAINLSATYLGWLEPIDFGATRGFYQAAFELSLTHADPEAQIWISPTGGTPNSLYQQPVSIADTCTLRASVTRTGYKSPPVQTHTYVFLDKVADSSVMNPSISQDDRFRDRLRQGLEDLPSIALAVSGLRDDYREHAASVEVLWPDGNTPVQADCALSRFGNAWQSFEKRSYRLKFSKDYGPPNLEAPLLNGFDHGWPVQERFDSLELRSGSQDMVDRGFYMAQSFVEDATLDMGGLNPHNRFVHLYINGAYWGMYQLRERLVKQTLADYLGGKTDDYVNVKGNDNASSSFIPGTPEPVHRASWDRVRDLAYSYEAVRPYLDIDGLIDFMVLWLYGNCETEYRTAGTVEAGSGMKFWSADADGFLRTSALNKSAYSGGPGDLFGRLMSERHPDFMMRLADRIYKHLFNDGALTPQSNATRLTRRMTEVENSLVAECARWGYRTPDNWEAAAADIQNNLFPQRTTRLVNDFRNLGMYPDVDPPNMIPSGGSVPLGFQLKFAQASGTVYFTTDGSDPRLPGGAVSPHAFVYGTGQQNMLTLVGANTGVTAIVPTNGNPTSQWLQVNFKPDGSWLSSTGTGIGFDFDTTYIPYIDLSLETRMMGINASVYARYPFEVTDPGLCTGLELSMRFDDGYAAYLNGTLIARENANNSLSWNSIATRQHSDKDAVVFQIATLLHPSPKDLLLPGLNVLAIQGLNVSVTSTDMLIEPQLKATQTQDTSDPSQLDRSTWVRARVRNGSEWSALTDAYFVVGQDPVVSPGDLAVTTLHYHPQAGEDQEFLVLTNVSDRAVNLRGCAFIDGIDYTFAAERDAVLAPGQGFTLAKSLFDFQQQHGIDIAVHGLYRGSLSNDGETLVLADAQGMDLLRFTYNDQAPWPRTADGQGDALGLVNPVPGIDHDDPANWQAEPVPGNHL